MLGTLAGIWIRVFVTSPHGNALGGGESCKSAPDHRGVVSLRRDGTEGEFVGNRLDKGLEIAGTGNGWLALKLCMEILVV